MNCIKKSHQEIRRQIKKRSIKSSGRFEKNNRKSRDREKGTTFIPKWCIKHFAHTFRVTTIWGQAITAGIPSPTETTQQQFTTIWSWRCQYRMRCLPCWTQSLDCFMMQVFIVIGMLKYSSHKDSNPNQVRRCSRPCIVMRTSKQVKKTTCHYVKYNNVLNGGRYRKLLNYWKV